MADVHLGQQSRHPLHQSSQPASSPAHLETPEPKPWENSTHLRNQNPVTLLNTHRQPVALLIHSTRTHSQDLRLVELLHAGLRKEDAAGGLGLGLDALDEDAVEEGREGADGAD